MASLALVMIVRDEEGCLARCLDAAAPIVDEMIVVDTGSVDGTAAVAAACGATVHHWAWRDDFSAARNHSLALSRCDWNLVLDADERITSGGDTLRKTLGEPFLGLVCRRNRIRVGSADADSFTWIPRLLPKGIRYAGRIHEEPVSSLPAHKTTLRLDHIGFDAASLARKKGRNERLLLAALGEQPGDVYLHFQLGNEYQVAQDFAKSASSYKAALARSSGKESYRHALVVRAIYSFKMAELLDDAVALVDDEIHNWPHSPDFYFTVGDLYLDLAVKHPHAALERLLPVVEYSWKKCLEIGERTDIEGGVRGRGSHMAAHNLAAFYRALGDQPKAAEFAAMAEEMKAA
ncbi:MAG: glycosyltransferase [Alphaproteobacteria bacterium]|nr:glycosyltransferase [Alphaproteobacteria bacterium]